MLCHLALNGYSHMFLTFACDTKIIKILCSTTHFLVCKSMWKKMHLNSESRPFISNITKKVKYFK